ncbi:hypothetical protein ACFJIY_07830 [Pimelobacter simplex]|uniref:hypothetical protein n=1 Tax=Nocardioides simplex TaxID=2045 RepID=UPI00366DF908
MTTRRSGLRNAALLLAFSALAAGCAGSDEEATVEGATVLIATGALEGESDVMVSGVVAKIGDCLGIKVEQTTYPLIWPKHVEVEDASVSLDGTTFGLGDELSGGGAFLPEPYPSQAPDIPEGCRSATGEIVLLSQLK